MTRRYPFEIQVVNRPFSAYQRIPDGLWRTVGRASHPVTALRRAERERQSVTPQRNAWSGHVRILCNGRPVVIEDHGNIVRGYDHATGETYSVEWQA